MTDGNASGDHICTIHVRAADEHDGVLLALKRGVRVADRRRDVHGMTLFARAGQRRRRLAASSSNRAPAGSARPWYAEASDRRAQTRRRK
jgi:hypothetical protein